MAQSGTVMMVATAHLDRKGRQVAHSVASSNGGMDQGNPMEDISEGKETVFITNESRFNGTDEIIKTNNRL